MTHSKLFYEMFRHRLCACRLFADDDWSKCFAGKKHGIYIWTAGQRKDLNPSSKFVWKLTANYPRVSDARMIYTNWYKGEPNNQWKRENCINLWKSIATPGTTSNVIINTVSSARTAVFQSIN